MSNSLYEAIYGVISAIMFGILCRYIISFILATFFKNLWFYKPNFVIAAIGLFFIFALDFRLFDQGLIATVSLLIPEFAVGTWLLINGFPKKVPDEENKINTLQP